uniref:Uncharacterized protein n=1 Tax=Ciona intestinalis TaxID=7719 RepID=H2XM42_CIOIN
MFFTQFHCVFAATACRVRMQLERRIYNYSLLYSRAVRSRL